MENCPLHLYKWFIPIIVIIGIWDSVWKIIAMWKAAQNKQLAWFIIIAVINTIGILPIIYILTHKKVTNN